MRTATVTIVMFLSAVVSAQAAPRLHKAAANHARIVQLDKHQIPERNRELKQQRSKEADRIHAFRPKAQGDKNHKL